MIFLIVYILDLVFEVSKFLLEDFIKVFGMLLNLYGIMVVLFQVLEGYKVLYDLFQKIDFIVEEFMVVW